MLLSFYQKCVHETCVPYFYLVDSLTEDKLARFRAEIDFFITSTRSTDDSGEIHCLLPLDMLLRSISVTCFMFIETNENIMTDNANNRSVIIIPGSNCVCRNAGHFIFSLNCYKHNMHTFISAQSNENKTPTGSTN